MDTQVIRMYREFTPTEMDLRRVTAPGMRRLAMEHCYYVGLAAPLTEGEQAILGWLLSETFEPGRYGQATFLDKMATVLEVGPRPNFETAFSSTAVSICHACGLNKVFRLERSTRYGIDVGLSGAEANKTLAPLFDRMTQMPYLEPLTSFERQVKPAASYELNLLGEPGDEQLDIYNRQLGCGWDEEDLRYIKALFRDKLKRNPTSVELFMIAQANSEHSRHHRFRGTHVLDGCEMPETLMDLVKAPWRRNPGNSVLAFCDDASAIRGRHVALFTPSGVDGPSTYEFSVGLVHRTHKAETHNHPSWISPFDGAATGSGGEFRDRMSVGRGGQLGMSGAGYMVGALKIPGYEQPWEKEAWPHPTQGASPLDILIHASNGVSAYGNCFGDPVTYGVTRSVALTLPDASHMAYHKPVVYVCGAGTIRDEHLHKQEPEKGMLIVHLGGPGYRIGLGGGAASSMLGGTNDAGLDFASVQRGAPQMEQRVYRVIRACVELGKDNPLVSTHDLGAGGLSNAVPELVHPQGGCVSLRSIPCGDASLSVLELWGNESQEREVFLIRNEHLERLIRIAEREGAPLAVIGMVTGTGHIVLMEDKQEGTLPIDLPLQDLFGSLPQKVYKDERKEFVGKPLQLPEGLTVEAALERVLRLPSVGSKAFLTNKVDRSVGGRVAQQQCVGPFHMPVADYAVLADSYFACAKGTAMERTLGEDGVFSPSRNLPPITGAVHSLGERPLASIFSPGAAARLAVTEALLNMCGAVIESSEGIKLAANWMLAARLPGRDAWLYDACEELSYFCQKLGIAIDGGKDSLSMAVKTKDPDGKDAVVESPPTLVIEAYASMPDITRKATPVISGGNGSSLIFIHLSPGKFRLGGSALAQAYGQLGKECPDVEHPYLVGRVFAIIQDMVEMYQISAVHDVSDGGLITTLVEMALASNMGINAHVPRKANRAGKKRTALEVLFNEEPGLIIQINGDEKYYLRTFAKNGIPAEVIGYAYEYSEDGIRRLVLRDGETTVLDKPLHALRQSWSETSFQIEQRQSSAETATMEALSEIRPDRKPPPYTVDFVVEARPDEPEPPKVAIIRAEGSNGDREMAAAFRMAQFEVVDVTMSDLLNKRISLDTFSGIAFVGGFSFADVLDSAKGWAGMVRFNEAVRDELERFRARPDTFSLGICNGCQLMALLGWVPGLELPMEKQPRFVHNKSGRFESRFSTLRIEKSPAIMLRGMEDSVLGCWVAHGEGQLLIPAEDVRERILEGNLVPMRYVNDVGVPTQAYPDNPNGSACAAAGLCSPDGRHLALMPHPERAVQMWQWPWHPDLVPFRFSLSPWLKMFQNAFDWSKEQLTSR